MKGSSFRESGHSVSDDLEGSEHLRALSRPHKYLHRHNGDEASRLKSRLHRGGGRGIGQGCDSGDRVSGKRLNGVLDLDGVARMRREKLTAASMHVVGYLVDVHVASVHPG